MKITLLLFLGSILLTLKACQTDSRESAERSTPEVNTEQETPVKLLEYLVGEWELERSSDSQESNNQETTLGNRLTFTVEARYMVRDGNQTIDSGAYRMNEQLGNLYLESEANKTPREYELELESDVLTLKPKDNSAQDSEYVYRRISPPSVPPDKSAEGDETEEVEQ